MPVLTHRESNIERTGLYSLYEDRIDVILKHALGGTLEFSVPLGELVPRTAILRANNSCFNAGLWILCLSILGYLPLWLAGVDYSGRLNSILGPFLAVGVAVCLLTFRKVRFVVLYGTDGLQKLAIGEGAGGSKELDVFISQVIDAIKLPHGTKA